MTIEKKYTESLKEAKLLSKSDVGEIAALSREKKLRDGKGYQNAQIRNVLFHQYTTTEELVLLIMDYYKEKKKMIDALKEKQEEFAGTLKTETV